MPSLLMAPPAPVIEVGRDRVVLDVKFLEGLKVHQSFWAGRLDCILRKGTSHIPFGREVDRADLQSDLFLLEPDSPLPGEMLRSYDIVFCSADAPLDTEVHDLLSGTDVKLVYSVEYTLETRLRIARLDRSRSLPRKIYSGLWTLRQERLRRQAFRRAHGLQANGYPAYRAYAPLTASPMLYLDTRMEPGMFASAEEMHDRSARLGRGAPLRLINSGRLEPMKGAQDLVPVADALRRGGLDFTLDIYGSGSLRDEIARDISRRSLDQRVFLHEPVDFETELVPIGRTGADVFLSCHRQSDPSCTYLESMGCGLPVAGYRNRMLMGLLEAADVGWAVPLGDVSALARKILELDGKRDEIGRRAGIALAFSSAHDFHSEVKARMEHLASLLEPRPDA